jgi:hypothetical protein
MRSDRKRIRQPMRLAAILPLAAYFPRMPGVVPNPKGGGKRLTARAGTAGDGQSFSGTEEGRRVLRR